MAAKPVVMGSRRLAYAVDALSKNAMADMLIDRACAELPNGEDSSEAEIVAKVQGWADTILRTRRDKPVNLSGKLKQWDKYADLARARQQATA